MAEADINLNIPIGGGGKGGSGFGAAITEKLAGMLSNLDVVGTMQKMIDSIPDDEESSEVRSKMQNIIEKFQGMSEEDKAQFTEQVRDGLMNRLGPKLEESGALNKIEEAISWAIWSKLYMIAAGFVLLVILLVFFGYKLYKSIKDKETKREEKKKAKQSKKKK